MRTLHLLLAEHDELRRHELAELLRGAGHTVLPAEGGAVAAEALAMPAGEAAPPFEFVLVDLSLPGIDLVRLREALAPAAATPPDALDAAERRHIVLALAHTQGNRREAAHLLGIARSTLLNKIRRYRIT